MAALSREGTLVRNLLPNERLRALLAEARWTSTAFARAVNRAGQEVNLTLSYDRTSVAHWLSGTRPRPPVPQLIAEVLSRKLGRNITEAAAGFTPSPKEGRAAPQDPRRKTDAAAHLAQLASSDSSSAQRLALQQSPYSTGLGMQIRWQETLSRAGRGRTHVPAPRAGRAEVETLKAAVQMFTTGLDRHGGDHGRTALTAFLADDVVPWLRRPASGQVRVELLTEAAYLVFVRARMCGDSGYHGAAQRFYQVALRLANEAEDLKAWSIVLRGMSSQALSLNHRRIALVQGERAYAALPPKTPPAIRSFVAAQLAVVRAASGARRDALAALADAECAATRAPADDGPFRVYPRAALEFQRAQALQSLGDITGALEALDLSSQHRRSDDRRGLALTHAAHATLLLRSGHVEAACASWRTFMTTGADLESAALDRTWRRLRSDFLPHRAQPTVSALLRTVPVPRTASGPSPS